MCGIVGYVTASTGKQTRWSGAQERKNFFEQALVVDTLRGEDSTGVLYGYATKPGQACGYHKDVLDGYSYTRTPEFLKWQGPQSGYRFAVGHNRAATVGGVTKATAHPFREGSITGLHNGTVRSGMLDLPVPMAKFEGTVDSHCIMHNLSVVEPEEALDKVISKIDGAYMLVWYDERDGSLNFARNSERAFHMTMDLDDNTIYFASEALELEWLCRRNGIKHGEICSLDPGHLLKFQGEGIEPTITEFTPAPKYSQYNSTAAYYNGGYHYSSPKPSAPYVQDNRVLLGGQNREVPAAMQMELLEWGLAVEDRLHVKPVQAQPVRLRAKPGKGYCVAFCDTLGFTCAVMGVDTYSLDQRMDVTWTVRPIGIRYQSPSEAMVLCRLVSTTSQQPEKLTLSFPSSTDETTGGDDGYAGPAGSLLTKSEWLVATEGGCAECSAAFILSDAVDVTWDGNEPVCYTCANVPAYDRAMDEWLWTDTVH